MIEAITRLGRKYFPSLRKQAYRQIPREVLLDLAEFCRANENCYHDDPRHHARLEGRREVWLRIRHHIDMTDEQQMALYTGNPPVIT